jgi:hypothetical protein
MKITIYVKEKHLENLYRFLNGSELETIDWYHNRPGQLSTGHCFMVTLDYCDFVKLNDR